MKVNVNLSSDEAFWLAKAIEEHRESCCCSGNIQISPDDENDATVRFDCGMELVLVDDKYKFAG